MRKTSVLMAIIAMTLSAMPMAVASDDPAITSPTAGEVIYQNTLNLEATADPDAKVSFAVRLDADADCIGGTNYAFESPAYADGLGAFERTYDISTWPSGAYCFVFNTDPDAWPTIDPAKRLVHHFYIVDDYAKVGGVVDIGGGTKGNGTHSFDGVVGKFGSTVVGSITVNDRNDKGYCTLTPTSLEILASAAGGERALMRVDSACWGDNLDFRVLDRTNNVAALSRGGVYFPVAGLIGTSSNYSWIPMLKGNNHVGTR